MHPSLSFCRDQDCLSVVVDASGVRDYCGGECGKKVDQDEEENLSNARTRDDVQRNAT